MTRLLAIALGAALAGGTALTAQAMPVSSLGPEAETPLCCRKPSSSLVAGVTVGIGTAGMALAGIGVATLGAAASAGVARGVGMAGALGAAGRVAVQVRTSMLAGRLGQAAVEWAAVLQCMAAAVVTPALQAVVAAAADLAVAVVAKALAAVVVTAVAVVVVTAGAVAVKALAAVAVTPVQAVAVSSTEASARSKLGARHTGEYRAWAAAPVSIWRLLARTTRSATPVQVGDGSAFGLAGV